jgi:hypothetical protein
MTTRKDIVKKLISEGFNRNTLIMMSDNELKTLCKTLFNESVMIKANAPNAAADIAAAKKAGKTIETYEGKENVCAVCGMKNCKCKDKKHGDVNEKWEGNVEVKKTGEHKDKTVVELKKELKSLKEKSKKYQDEGKKVPKKIIDQESELKFAIRAKQGWKDKIKENTEIKEWVLSLAESKFTKFTSKKDIMGIINEKVMETSIPMPRKAKIGHNGVPEFMTYDSIVGNNPSTAPSPSQPEVSPDAPPREKPNKPKTPYQPGPGTNPKPKALAEKKKIK